MWRRPEPSDVELLTRMARGDERSFRRLVQRHQTLAFGIAYRILGSWEDAEEIASSAFVRLWKSAGEHRGEASVKSYLCSILVNLCRDRLRQRRLPILPDDSTDSIPEDQMLIRCALRQISPEDREAIVLHHIQGLTTAEAASALGIETGAFKMRLIRARQRLRLILEDKDE